MFGIPLEVISMLASTIMGAYMKMKAQDQADKADQHRMMLERGKATERSRNAARNMTTRVPRGPDDYRYMSNDLCGSNSHTARNV